MYDDCYPVGYHWEFGMLKKNEEPGYLTNDFIIQIRQNNILDEVENATNHLRRIERRLSKIEKLLKDKEGK